MAARDDVADRARGDVERAAGERVLQPMIERLEETAEDDEAYREAETDALAAVRHCAAALSTRERALLDELRDWARGAQDRPDAKLNAPREGLDPIVAQDHG